MKNLDLNSYGVQEMNFEEMKTTEGGGWHWLSGILDGILGAAITIATGGTGLLAIAVGAVCATIGGATGVDPSSVSTHNSSVSTHSYC